MIIGLSGYAQTGKDTLGTMLVEDHGFVRYAFADALKNSVYALNPLVLTLRWTSSDNDYKSPEFVRVQNIVDDVGWEDAKKVPEIRRLLQAMGTEAGRRVLGEDVWVNAVFNQVTQNGDENVVITDARFPNEAKAIKAAGGYVVRVKRPGVGALNDHPSEISLDDWGFDYSIVNDDTPEVLRSKAVDLVQGLRKFADQLVPSVRLPGYGAPVARVTT